MASSFSSGGPWSDGGADATDLYRDLELGTFFIIFIFICGAAVRCSSCPTPRGGHEDEPRRRELRRRITRANES
ncbi:hypothetical protein EYF80_059051 [Liparis tanakae]|uniref:Uncharacterized protein n=1 Tax=Liparis tanakae TaxID=230148 RepID=A0A4Z2ER06_9TELE|nr:hypothetical protein EYF80_059051 [Liparis tanakae]